jgi:hypothetical protein
VAPAGGEEVPLYVCQLWVTKHTSELFDGVVTPVAVVVVPVEEFTELTGAEPTRPRRK